MTGIEIFFCGGFLVIAIFCLLLLTGIIKPVSQKKASEEKEEKDEKVSPKEDAASDNAQVAAPSKFNVDEFMAQISSEVISDVRKELPKILKDAIGEVKISDIKFEEGFDEDEEFVPRKFKALNEDETDDAFNTDLRNIDDTPPSEPIATGTSMDELEEAMDVAMDKNSSDEDLAKAGKVIEPYTVTKLFDAITTNEEIDRRIELCLTLALRAELSMKLKPSKKDSHNNEKKEPPSSPVPPEAPVNPESEETIKQAEYDFNKLNSDDFDLDDFIG